jgi:hypothetical protein
MHNKLAPKLIPNKISSLHTKFICIALLSMCFTLLRAQHLKITNDKHIAFAESMAVQFPDKIKLSSAIREYDVEKIIKVAYNNFNQLSSGNQQLFFDFINQYDHNKILVAKASEKVQVDSFFYSYVQDTSSFSQNPYVSQKPILKYFYKSPYHFLSVDAENFTLRADPIVQLAYGNASNHSNTIFKNLRGAEVSGYIDNKVYFYTRILENQEGFLPNVNQYINTYKAIPQNGLYKPYNSAILSGLTGYDFLNAQAYVGIPISKSIALELGHGRHNIGNGIRSLLLSDFSNNYFYLKFNTNVWKLHYQNIFAELNSTSANFDSGDQLLGKKYMANHYLSIRPFKNFEIGLFESVIFARENQFELQYLNPVILYRMAEQFLGSSDNALIGLNASYTITQKIMLYGQLMLDEFNLELIKKDGWYGNKQAAQLGIKYYDAFGMQNLTAQLEYNAIRPYTYSHNRPSDKPITVSNYSHYGMPLAHPLGANTKEIIFTLNYRPTTKFNFDFTLASMSVGRDINGLNYGGNVLVNSNSYVNEYGNKILQGERNDITFLRLNATYEVFKNYKIFVNPQYRKSVSKDAAYNYSNIYLGGGITINFDLDKNIY